MLEKKVVDCKLGNKLKMRRIRQLEGGSRSLRVNKTLLDEPPGLSLRLPGN
jgi:hypothetical protein